MKHNNVTPNAHFRKYWQKYVRTWLNQPARAKRRRDARQEKATRSFPRPTAGLLRPAVRSPTQRYNLKIRLGKGFTLDELKAAGISKKLAPTIGIAVDYRRKNRCMESLNMNVRRLKLYKSKLMIFPRGSKAKQGDSQKSELANVAQNTHKQIIPLPKKSLQERARAITADEKEKSAFKTMRKARVDARQWGKRNTKKEEATK